MISPSPRTSRINSNRDFNFLQPLPKLFAALANICEQLLVFECLQKFQSHGANERPAAKRRAMQARRKRGSNLLIRENRAERQPACQRLRDRHDVRLCRKLLIRKVASRAPQPALNFVGDQQRSCFVASSRARAPEAFAYRINSAFALNRFEHNRANGVVEFRFRGPPRR